MREIKFRGLGINGGWYYGLFFKSLGAKGQLPKGFYLSIAVGIPWAYQIRPETVGQYTGLKDKNGKEIYEGDILESKVYVPGCENNPKFWPRLDRQKVEYKRLYDSEYDSNYNMGFTVWMDGEKENGYEVIGNIYENPKLGV